MKKINQGLGVEHYLQEKSGLTPILAAEEAARCLLCLDAPCSKSCPANSDPAKFIRSIRFRNIEGAVDTLRINNPLAGVCARVCPTEKYCQQGCIRAGMDRPIDIAALQRFLTDYEQQTGYQAVEPVERTKERIAVIGSGPAGLSCANILARNGYQVTIFEKHNHAGGYLTYGIPPYRLPEQVVDNEIRHTLDLGVKIIYEAELGRNISFASLKVEGFKAVVLATGYDTARTLPNFSDNPYVESAIDFLSRVKVSEGQVALPNSMLVIGGGDVAMDVAVTAKKLGVKDVTAVARETMEEFPASVGEFDEAINCNVSVIAGFTPVAVQDNTVTFRKVDLTGDSELRLQADKIILAIGQISSGYDPSLEVSHHDLAVEGYRTNLEGIFACGDIVEGDKTVVAAIGKGKACAEAVMNYLKGAR